MVRFLQAFDRDIFGQIGVHCALQGAVTMPPFNCKTYHLTHSVYSAVGAPCSGYGDRMLGQVCQHTF